MADEEDKAYSETISIYRKKLMPRLYSKMRRITCPFKNIEKVVPKNCLVLDIGAGYGMLSVYIALKDKTRKVTGFDINKKSMDVAQELTKEIKNVSFFAQDVTKADELKKSDVVIMNDLLHHIKPKEQEILLLKIFSNLKKGGRVIIKEIDTKPLWKYYWNYFHDLFVCWERISCRSADNWEELLTKIGFSVSRINMCSRLPYPHIMFVCDKKN